MLHRSEKRHQVKSTWYFISVKSVSILVGLEPLMSFSSFWDYWASRISPAEIARKLSVATTNYFGSRLPPLALWHSAGSVLGWGKPTVTSPNRGRARPTAHCRWKLFTLPRVSLSRWTLPCETDTVLLGRADRAVGNRGSEKELVLDHVDLPESSEVPAMPTQLGEAGGKVKGPMKTEPGTMQAFNKYSLSEWVRQFYFSNASHLNKMLPSPPLRVCLKRDAVHVSTGKCGLSRSVEAEVRTGSNL